MFPKEKTCRLGRTGMEVSPLGFGGLPIQRVDKEQAQTILLEAVERGINFIDTARKYADSEEKIGEALKRTDERVYLASKSPARDKEGVLEDLEVSLNSLKVEKIDLYQLHGVNDDETLQRVLQPGAALEGLKEAKNLGKIDHIGVTGHRNDTLIEAVKTEKFDTVMFAYNFIENDCEEGLIRHARDKKVGMLAMKPLAGGRLLPSSAALKYVLDKKNVVPIPGMQSRREVVENLEIAEGSWELTSQEKRQQENQREKLGSVFCRRCDYCQPCPQEIEISTVLRAEPFVNRMTSKKIKELGVLEAFEQAKDCTECGTCIERCPYNLPVPDLIKENRKVIKEHF